MEIEYQNTKQDYINFCKINLKRGFSKIILAIIIGLTLIIGILSNYHLSVATYLLSTVIYATIVAAWIYFIPLWRFTNALNKRIANDNDFLHTKKVVVTDKGLIKQGAKGDILWHWESIAYANTLGEFFHIKLTDKKYLLVPRKSFTTNEEAVNFLGIIQAKIINASGTATALPLKTLKNPIANPIINPKKNSPYLLGLLGFIPLVGAFVGVGLILYGIFQYKDKWLVFIGLACVAFTIFVYSSLFYSTKNSKVFKDGFANISQMQLNSLVKEIEFYKLENGVYPDSLQQLGLKDSFTNIDDPLLSGKKNDTYNYHRIGNKYTLFSSGPDQIPNTADDIYPSIKIDTSKIGLIIRKK
jgi:hypothetical protein